MAKYEAAALEKVRVETEKKEKAKLKAEKEAMLKRKEY